MGLLIQVKHEPPQDIDSNSQQKILRKVTWSQIENMGADISYSNFCGNRTEYDLFWVS